MKELHHEANEDRRVAMVKEAMKTSNKHEDEITELGKEHSIVTRNTSLIVLDRLEDYVTHRIMPPEADLRQQYLAETEQQQKEKEKNETRKRNVHTLIRVLRKLRASTCLKFYTSIYFLILRETNALFLFYFANGSVHS